MGIDFKNTEKHYGLVARVLHRSSVAVLVGVIYFSGLMEGLKSGPEKLGFVYDHASFGIAFLALMLVRFLWRLWNLNPVRSYSIKSWQKGMAINLHRALYAVFIIEALIGLVILFSNGEKLVLFKYLALPSFMEMDGAWAGILRDCHRMILNGIYFLLFIHISSAVYHQIFGVLEGDD